MTHSYSTGQWQYPTYNALGQRVEDYQSAGSSDSMKLYYPRDIFGDRTGIWDDHSSVNWVGWDIYWSKVAGQRLNMGRSSAYIDHADAVGSTTMETDPAGGTQWDIVYFPWGQIWQQTGTRQSGVFADLDWQVNDPLHPSATREYSGNVNRWMTPDPGGRSVVKLDDPQTWNMYAYVGNNPTTLNDPAGLQPDSPFTFVPNNYCYGFSCVKRFGSTGESTGVTVQGDDIFDALEGSPGTYLNFNQSGNLNFGFSEDLWVHDWSQAEKQYRTSPAYLDAVNAQLAAAIAGLEAKGKGQQEITAFENYESQNFNSLYVEGGNVNFGSRGPGFNFANFGCPNGRCDLGAFGALDFSHNKGATFHLDTADPWTSPGGFAKHTWVDVVLGNFGYYVIPRPWTW